MSTRSRATRARCSGCSPRYSASSGAQPRRRRCPSSGRLRRGTARGYAELATDAATRAQLLSAIEAEQARTRAALEAIYGDKLEHARWRIAQLLGLRNAGLGPVHQRQIELLRAWRASERADESLRLSLLGTVNAIAAGLRTTG